MDFDTGQGLPGLGKKDLLDLCWKMTRGEGWNISSPTFEWTKEQMATRQHPVGMDNSGHPLLGIPSVSHSANLMSLALSKTYDRKLSFRNWMSEFYRGSLTIFPMLWGRLTVKSQWKLMGFEWNVCEGFFWQEPFSPSCFKKVFVSSLRRKMRHERKKGWFNRKKIAWGRAADNIAWVNRY